MSNLYNQHYTLLILVFTVVILITGCSQGPTSKTMATKIEQYEKSLSKTTELLGKRIEQRKVAQQKFFDECAIVNKSAKDAATELQKSESKQKTTPWFEHVQIYWLDWKDLERDVVIFTRQKERLEKSLRNMKPLLGMLKRKEENKQVYIPGEDPELDKLVASIEIDLDLDDLSKKLSSAEKTAIDVEVNNNMTEIINSTNDTIEEPSPQQELPTEEEPNVEITLSEEEESEKITNFPEISTKENTSDNIKNGSKAGERMVQTINGVEFAFRWCPAGTFTMGSPESEEGREDCETQHQVTLTKGFWMMETEVTQKQWKAVMGSNPSYFKGDDLPVEEVSWDDCQEFCKECTELDLPVCLPTEAQWEYACRAGTTEPYAENLDDMAWYWGNSSKTQPVGTKTPNAWDLYDMHGNVWEWCSDWYTKEHYEDNATNPVGPFNGSIRVIRGGSWNDATRYCRSAYRCFSSPENRSYNLGFRVVLKGQ